MVVLLATLQILLTVLNVLMDSISTQDLPQLIAQHVQSDAKHVQVTHFVLNVTMDLPCMKIICVIKIADSLALNV